MERIKFNQVINLFGVAAFFLSLNAQAGNSFDNDLSDQLPNPASVHPLMSKTKPFVIELGLEYMHPDLPSVSGIVVENQTTSNTIPTSSSNPNGVRVGTVNSDYPDVLAQTLKVQALLDDSDRWTVALRTYLPLNSLSQLDSGYIYQPEFVLYRAEKQRPRILLTTGIDLGEKSPWRVGLGIDVGFSVEAQASVYLQSGTTNSGAATVSDQRIKAKLKPTFTPQASLAYLNYAFTVRGENKVKFDLTADASARVFSTSGAGVDFSYLSTSAAYYQPWDLELSGKTSLGDSVNLKWIASYQLWSRYEARAALVQPAANNCNGQPGCPTTFSPSAAPEFKARNLFVPEIGFEFLDEGTRYQIGYRFKDSIFSGTPSGNGNYLDPPRHDLLLAAIFHLKNDWEWGVNAQVSRLTSQTVVKSDPNSIGGTTVAGAGYTVAGWQYGAGVNITVPFKE